MSTVRGVSDEPDQPTAHGDADPSGDHVGDTLPEDLDVTAFVGPYTFPDIRRRLIAAALYAVIAVASLLIALAGGGAGFAGGGVALLLVAAHHALCAWPLRVDQTEALATASRTVGFPIGHASAQLAFRGLRSRPVWQVLVYSADDPPSIRGLVQLDGVDGHVLGEYTEQNPEDWAGSARSSGQP